MKEIDKYLIGEYEDFSYEKYGTTRLMSLMLNDRFKVVYSISDRNILFHKGDFECLFDTEKQKLYVASDYYNYIVDNTDFEYETVSSLIEEIKEEVNNSFNAYVHTNAEVFKKSVRSKFESFYSAEENLQMLTNKAISLFKESSKGKETTFSNTVNPEIQDVIAYLTNRECYLKSKIDERLEYSKNKNCRVSSAVSGMPDLFLNGFEYIGCMLLEDDVINKKLTELESNADPDILLEKKLKELTQEWVKQGIKTVVITFERNNKIVTAKYPVDSLSRMYIDEWYFEVADRPAIKDLFSDVRWSRDIEKAKAIKEIKYRGKVIYSK